MNKYSMAMDEIKVTPQMEERILRNVFDENALINVQEKVNVKRKPFEYKWFQPASISAIACAILILFISTNWNKAPDDTLQHVGSPIVTHQGIKDLKASVPFEVAVPGKLPDGYLVEETSAIQSFLAQIIYSDGDNKITYRTAEGSEDISGDYTVYDTNEIVTIGDLEATFKGNGDLIYLAIWSNDSYSYALSFTKGFDKDTVVSIIENME